MVSAEKNWNKASENETKIFENDEKIITNVERKKNPVEQNDEKECETNKCYLCENGYFVWYNL